MEKRRCRLNADALINALLPRLISEALALEVATLVLRYFRYRAALRYAMVDWRCSGTTLPVYHSVSDNVAASGDAAPAISVHVRHSGACPLPSRPVPSENHTEKYVS